MITVTQKDQSVILSGLLTRTTITRAFDKKYRDMVNAEKLTLDFLNVSQIDTAGLAWILLLIELAGKKGCEIKLVNLPKDLIKLAQLSGADNLLFAYE